jgi:hypothetical protein
MARQDDDQDQDERIPRATAVKGARRRSRAGQTYWYAPEPTGSASKPTDVANVVVTHVKWLLGRASKDRLRDRIHEAIYENQPLSPGGQYAQAVALLKTSGFRPSRLNVAKSITETWRAKLGKRRPVVSVTADDANWSEKLRAEQLTRFVQAKQRETDLERLRPEVLLDCGKVGTGIARIGKEFGEICADRVFKEEVLVDPRECRYGKPRNLYHYRRVSRDVLAEMYPDQAEEIFDLPETEARRDAFGYEDGEYMGDGAASGQVDVYEAWHLPSGPEAKDGRYALCAPGLTLEYGQWKRQRFPFAFMRRNVRARSFWGVGLVEDVAEIQYQINETCRTIQENFYYGSALRVATPRQSGVAKAHLAGRHPSYFEYDVAGGPPAFIAPNPVSPQQIDWLERLISKAHDLTGVSMLSAASKNPLGAGASGAALDTFYDIESERFSMDEAELTNFTVDCADLYIDTAKEIDEERKASKSSSVYTATWIGGGSSEKIEWSKVDMKRDQFVLVPEPTNFIPTTRGGKLAAVEQLTKAGVLGSGEGGEYEVASLFDEPDVSRAMRMRTAVFKNWERCMEILANPEKDLVENRVYVDSHMLMGAPGLGKRMTIAYYNDAQSRNAPEEVLERYRFFLEMIRQAEDELAAAATPAAPPMDPAAAGGMPPDMGAPMPPGVPPMPPPGPGQLPPMAQLAPEMPIAPDQLAGLMPAA